MVSSRSHSYILVDEYKQEDKSKSKSMKKGYLQSLEVINRQVMNQLLSYHRCLNLAKSDIYDRAYGAMFGFLIGDSMGAYLVNLPYNEAQINAALLMRGGGAMNLKSGECTDEW